MDQLNIKLTFCLLSFFIAFNAQAQFCDAYPLPFPWNTTTPLCQTESYQVCLNSWGQGIYDHSIAPCDNSTAINCYISLDIFPGDGPITINMSQNICVDSPNPSFYAGLYLDDGTLPIDDCMDYVSGATGSASLYFANPTIGQRYLLIMSEDYSIPLPQGCLYDVTVDFTTFEVPSDIGLQIDGCIYFQGIPDKICTEDGSAEVTAKLSGVEHYPPNSFTYNWSLTSSSGASLPFTWTSTMGEELKFELSEGSYELCLTVSNSNVCTSTSETICETIEVTDIPDEDLGFETLCELTLFNGYTPEDWLGPDIFQPGFSSYKVTTNCGCDYTQSIYLDYYFLTPDQTFDLEVCTETLQEGITPDGWLGDPIFAEGTHELELFDDNDCAYYQTATIIELTDCFCVPEVMMYLPFNNSYNDSTQYVHAIEPLGNEYNYMEMMIGSNSDTLIDFEGKESAFYIEDFSSRNRSDFSISFWFNIDTNAFELDTVFNEKKQTILTDTEHIFIQLEELPGQVFELEYRMVNNNQDTVELTSVFQAETWYHVVLSYSNLDNGTMRMLSQDNILAEDSLLFEASMNYDFYLGAYGYDNIGNVTQHFNGFMENFIIWDQALEPYMGGLVCQLPLECDVFQNVVLSMDEILLSNVLNGDEVTLSWELPSHVSFSEVVLERRSEGVNFEPLHSIDNPNLQYFDVVDSSPLVGLNYYRVSTKTDEGRIVYSNIVSANMTSQSRSTAQLYPIPATDYIQLDGMDCSDCLIHLYDSNYREFNVEKSLGQDGKISLDIERLPSGIYFLHIDGKDNEVLKFVKI